MDSQMELEMSSTMFSPKEEDKMFEIISYIFSQQKRDWTILEKLFVIIHLETLFLIDLTSADNCWRMKTC